MEILRLKFLTIWLDSILSIPEIFGDDLNSFKVFFILIDIDFDYGFSSLGMSLKTILGRFEDILSSKS